MSHTEQGARIPRHVHGDVRTGRLRARIGQRVPRSASRARFRTAKTASRSVLGVMNEFKFLAEVEAQFVDEQDLLSLSLRLAETPCGPLYKRHISPDRELAAIVRSHQ